MLTENRHIVHMDLDSFFVSVERLLNSDLLGKPVIIGAIGDRGVVAACSYEARKFGVHSAMPMKTARSLCPQAIIVRGDYDQYSKYSGVVTQIIADAVPQYEKTSIDEHYIDLTGMDRFFGCLKWTQELRQKITKESGLPISFGLSVNKTVSKIATDESKPNGEKHIPKDIVQPFLDPLTINKIPMVGEKTAYKLRTMGVHTIATLRKIPIPLMQKLMGEHGISIWEKANGIDNNPVLPYTERKSISEETTFDQDTIDIKMIEDKMVLMLENLTYQLRKSGKLTGCLTIKIRYSNFDTHTQQMRVFYTSADHVLLPKLKEIFNKLYDRRMSIRLIGVKLSNLVSGHHQINLFEDTSELVNLYQALDKVKKRFGDHAIFRAVGLE
jgi:DNA polymerase IV